MTHSRILGDDTYLKNIARNQEIKLGKNINLIALKQVLRDYQSLFKEKIRNSIFDYNDVPMNLYSSVDSVFYYSSSLRQQYCIEVEFYDDLPSILNDTTLFQLLITHSHQDMKIQLSEVVFKTIKKI